MQDVDLGLLWKQAVACENLCNLLKNTSNEENK